MRRYTILSIIKTISGVSHRYDAVRQGGQLTGNYYCATLDDTKIASDFICMPNSNINSVRCSTSNLEFQLNEETTQGRITGFRPNNAAMDVLLNNARAVGVDLSTLTKRVAAQTVTPVTAIAPPAQNQNQTPVNVDIRHLEEIIVRERDIRLANTMKASIPATLEEFLIRFFKRDNNEKNTIYVDDKTVYTTPGRRRSLGDIFKICKYYFPQCTLHQVLVLLYTTLPTRLTGGFRTSYCSTIHKRVWYYSPGDGNTVANEGTQDEYGHLVSWYRNRL